MAKVKDRGIIRRCTGAGYVFGFSTSVTSIEDFGFKRSPVPVRPPCDLGR
jgi:hypothetical protein